MVLSVEEADRAVMACIARIGNLKGLLASAQADLWIANRDLKEAKVAENKSSSSSSATEKRVKKKNKSSSSSSVSSAPKRRRYPKGVQRPNVRFVSVALGAAKAEAALADDIEIINDAHVRLGRRHGEEVDSHML